MRRHLEAFLARHPVPGIGCATVGLDEHVQVEVLGVTRRGGQEAIDPADAWHIGSCAKAITAALYAKLVGDGRAAWDTPISDLFPDLRGSIDPGWSTPTVNELLTCRSGVRGNLTRAQTKAAYADQRPPVQQRTDAVIAALARPPHGHGRFVYSNLGYVVVGAAIDRLAGQPYESALQSLLLHRLGVRSAGFGPPPRIWGHRPRIQLGSICVGRGPGADPGELYSDNAPVLTPAGRLHLNVADWALVQRLFLDGAGLIEPAALAQLLRLPADGRGMAMGWASARLPGARLGMQGSNTSWAASALLAADGRRIAMAVTNDGRTSMLRATAFLAATLLGDRAT